VVLSERGLPEKRTQPGFWRISHAEPGRSIWLGLVMSGGLCLTWLQRVLSAGPHSSLTFQEMVALSADVPAGARGLTFVPFLEGAATPYAAPEARAALYGLSSSHGAGDIVQAVMEGVAFNTRQCVELFESLGGTISEIRIAEGGARVERWCQIIADVLERPVIKIEELDASALGAALMAQVVSSGRNLEALVDRAVQRSHVFQPNHQNAPAYRAAYRRYLTHAGIIVQEARNASAA
jgi:xylulokinase